MQIKNSMERTKHNVTDLHIFLSIKLMCIEKQTHYPACNFLQLLFNIKRRTSLHSCDRFRKMQLGIHLLIFANFLIN